MVIYVAVLRRFHVNGQKLIKMEQLKAIVASTPIAIHSFVNLYVYKLRRNG